MPINPIPDPAGNVAAWQVAPGRWYGEVLTVKNRDEHASAGHRAYVAHWAECPDQRPRKREPEPEPDPDPQESLF